MVAFNERTPVLHSYLEEILNGKINIVNFKDVAMNDLLGRTPVEPSADGSAIAATYSGKRILVTGAGGSIGSELALQFSKFGPGRLLLLDKDENGLNDAYLHLDESIRATASAVVADRALLIGCAVFWRRSGRKSYFMPPRTNTFI